SRVPRDARDRPLEPVVIERVELGAYSRPAQAGTGAGSGAGSVRPTRSRSQNDASIEGPMRSAKATVPAPIVPPRAIPPASAHSSSPPRTIAMRSDSRREPTTMSESRGPAPKAAPRYRPEPSPVQATPAA